MLIGRFGTANIYITAVRCLRFENVIQMLAKKIKDTIRVGWSPIFRKRFSPGMLATVLDSRAISFESAKNPQVA